MSYTDELRLRFQKLAMMIDHNYDQLQFETEPGYRSHLREQIDRYIQEQLQLAEEIQATYHPKR